MGSVNKVILLGNLGSDPEMRMTPSGQQVATISIATSESWVKDGRREDKVEWHRVVLWNKLAELASKYLKKGRKVYIEGRLQTRSWEDQTGQKRYTTEIIGNQMTFVDSGKREENPQAPGPYSSPYQGPSQSQTQDDDWAGSDVPF